MRKIPRWVAGIAAAVMLLSPSGASAQVAPTDALSAWLVNTSATNPFYHASTDVQSAEIVNRGGQQFAEIKATGIPGYATTVTPDLLAGLAARAKSDFRSGSPTVTVGQVLAFGQDVGYATRGCDGQPGMGYWPPGPVCATVQQRDAQLPLRPRMAGTPQATTVGAIGLWVNGTSVFNWADANSYRNQGVWQQIAAVFEGNSMDVCSGHAANGEYHLHFYSPCLAQQVGDDGSGHSPIYGFAADGIPIYGPWVAGGQLAHSGWKLRDFESASSPTGCGGGGQRTCLLVDQTDPSKGVTPASQPGPNTKGLVQTLMGRNMQAVAGAYEQDYYYDRSCGDCLDEHNGVDNGDGLGYHYVITVERSANGSLSPVFPYILGPTYAGVPVGIGLRQAGPGGQGAQSGPAQAGQRPQPGLGPGPQVPAVAASQGAPGTPGGPSGQGGPGGQAGSGGQQAAPDGPAAPSGPGGPGGQAGQAGPSGPGGTGGQGGPGGQPGGPDGLGPRQGGGAGPGAYIPGGGPDDPGS